MGNISHTVGGDSNLVSFKSAARVPITSLKAHFKPKQDLHGYSKPWPAGGGKNLWDEVYTDITSGSIKYRSIYVGANDITASTTAPKAESGYSNLFIIAGEVSSGASSDTNGFWINSSRTVTPIDGYVTIAYRNSSNVDPQDYKTQIEIGSTATSYEPYENICPIEGWNTVETQYSKKNLLDTTKNNRTTHPTFSTENGIVNCSSVTAWNSTHIWFTQVFPAGTYTISCDYSGTGSNGPRLVCSASINEGTWNNSYQGYWKNFTGRSCTFTTNEAFSVALVFISRTDHNGESCTFYNIQLEQGTSTTEYEPYQGTIIPITFPVLGKNKLPIIATASITTVTTSYDNTVKRNLTVGTIYQCVSSNNYWPGNNNKTFVSSVSNGTITYQSNDGAYGVGICVDAIPNQDYIVSYTTNEAVKIRYAVYAKDGTWLEGINTYKIHTPEQADKMLIILTPASPDVYNTLITAENLQLELGNIATTYEPYSSNNTVYGGYVDLINGELVQEWIDYPLTSTLAWYGASRNSSGKYFYYDNYNSKQKCLWGAGNWYSINTQEKYTHGKVENPWSAVGNNAWAYASGTTTTTIRVSFSDDVNINSVNDLKNWLDDQGNVSICYPLETPITVATLTPSQLTAFLNQNNIWSNTNDITEVSYAIHDSAPIRAAKQRIAAFNARKIADFKNILRSNYLPNGATWVDEVDIDFDVGDYIEASIDLSSCTGVGENILSIGTVIDAWAVANSSSHVTGTEDIAVHFYYPASSGTTKLANDLSYTAVADGTETKHSRNLDKITLSDTTLIIKIDYNNVYVNGTAIITGSLIYTAQTIFQAKTKLLVGSLEGANRSHATYNYIKVVRGQ